MIFVGEMVIALSIRLVFCGFQANNEKFELVK